jgi:hypothetical protein
MYSPLLTRIARAAILAVAALVPTLSQAADHGDSPNIAHDRAADIGDLYFFLDPATPTQAVMIMTIHGFIVPGEAVNFGIFDPTLLYRFEIENTGDAIPDKFISVTFSPRVAIDGPAPAQILQVPQAQTATISVTGSPLITKTTSQTAISAMNPSLAATAPDPVANVRDITIRSGTTDISAQFFAGEVDDPFFFDIPGFARFIGDRRSGTPILTAANQFSRARDSFAGYNTLVIALRVPVSFLQSSNPRLNPKPTRIGLSCSTLRRVVQANGPGGRQVGSGAFRQVDRTGIPAVNVALIPFNRKNEYNVATPFLDRRGIFATDILRTLEAIQPTLDTGAETSSPSTLGGNAATLAQVAVLNGDILRLETNTTVTPLSTGFPNGRRLQDDVIDTLLTLIANLKDTGGAPISVGDGVPANDRTFLTQFPFVAPAQQPLANGVTDDGTRN